MIDVFSIFTEILKIYMTLSLTSCEAERNFCNYK